jgi:hypothetical protein
VVVRELHYRSLEDPSMRARLASTLLLVVTFAALPPAARAGEPRVVTPKKLERPPARFVSPRQIANIDDVYPMAARKVGKDQIAVTLTTFYGANGGAQQTSQAVTIVRPNELMAVGVHRGMGGFEQTLSVMASPGGKLTTEYRVESPQKGTEVLVAAQHAVELRSAEHDEQGVTLKGLAYRMGTGERASFAIKVPNGAGRATYDLGMVSSARVQLELDGAELHALSVLH